MSENKVTKPTGRNWDELRIKFLSSPKKLDLLYTWIKQDRISGSVFKKLLEEL